MKEHCQYVSFCPLLMPNNQRVVCNLPLRSESHCWCRVTRAQSSTDTAEPPAAPPGDKKAESESGEHFGERDRLRILSKTRPTYERFFKKQLSSSRYLRRRCCCAAALQQQERRQELKQLPLAEVMAASNTEGESGIGELQVNVSLILQQGSELTCGKPWVFSVWLKSPQFFHRQQKNIPTTTTNTK